MAASPHLRGKWSVIRSSTTPAPLSGGPEVQGVEAGLPVLQALADIRRVARPYGATRIFESKED